MVFDETAREWLSEDSFQYPRVSSHDREVVGAFTWANGEVMSTTNKRVRLRGDGASRMSGSPHYFCPDGAVDTCGPSDKGEIIMIHAGFVGSPTNRVVGPKASAFEAQAVNIIQAN